MAENDFNLAGLFLVTKRRWRLVAAICSITAVVAAVVNFRMLPKWYESKTIIMPPQEKSAFSGLGMLLSRVKDLPGGISRVASGIASISSSQYLFVVILNSRTVADSLIEKYDLEKVYKTKYRFKARKQLRAHTEIDFPPEGHIVITVEAKEDPQLACALANEYVMQLNNILMDRGIFTATLKSRFLKGRLEETGNSLRALEDSLREFQETYKIIQPEEQAKELVGLMGTLLAERENKLIQLRIRESVYTSRHPIVKMLKTETEELDRTIARITRELTSGSSSGASDNPIHVSQDIPTISMAYTRLYRSVKIQEEMFMLLSAQYEEARINGTDDTPGAIVLDPAIVPEYKSRPRRLLNILISTAAAFVICLVFLAAASRTGRRSEFPT